MTGLLTALQHADSAFPSGSFAFSNGIEGLAALRGRLGRDGLGAVVAATIRHRWAPAERIALVRAYRAGDDLDAIGEIDNAVEAATLAESLRMGSSRNGAALLAAHIRLATPGVALFRGRIDAGRARGHLPVVQGFVWRSLGLSEDNAAAVSGYTTAAGLIAAAVRLNQVGAIEAQAVLASALDVISDALKTPVAPNAEIESFTPLLDIAAARQARALLRLFVN